MAMRTYILAACAALVCSPAVAGPDLDKAERFDAVARVELDAKTQVAMGRSAVLGLLKDPGSAQFRSVGIYSSRRGTVICGEVNAKNGFGGYQGYRGFVVAHDIAYVEQPGLDGYWFLQAHENFCRGAQQLSAVKF